MRLKKAIAPAADSVCGATAYAAAPPPRVVLSCVLVLVALSACGSVQTTTSGGIGSTVQSVADPEVPVVTGVPPTAAQVGITYSYTPAVSDPLSTALTFNITNMPGWATFNSATGELQGTPSADDVGATNEIEISVSDGVGIATVGPFRITVSAPASTPPSSPPTISGTPPANVIAGQAYLFAPSASDPAGNALTFSIINRPSWSTFSTSTGQLTGTPNAANVGSYANITISVSDGILTASLPAFTVTVSASVTDAPPTITGNPATSVNAGSAYSFTPSASDPAGNALTFSIRNQPSWANFDSETGQLSGTPLAANIGSYPNILISVSDGTQSASLPAFTITVSQRAVDQPPTIGGNPATSVNVGSAYSFTPSASDPEGQPLTFSIQNQPSWAAFDTGSGQLSGTPTAGDVGSFSNIIISVSDGTLSASLPAFSIAVTQISTGAVTVNWSTPTQNTNGTPLVNLAGFRIFYGTDPNNLSQSAQIANPGLTSYVLSDLAPGTWYIGLSDYTASGVQSSLSNIASTTVH